MRWHSKEEFERALQEAVAIDLAEPRAHIVGGRLFLEFAPGYAAVSISAAELAVLVARLAYQIDEQLAQRAPRAVVVQPPDRPKARVVSVGQVRARVEQSGIKPRRVDYD